MIKAKNAFERVPELKNPVIEKLIREATKDDRKRCEVSSVAIRNVEETGITIRDCAVVITQLVEIFDELGSHPIPVYKALLTLIQCLCGPHRTNYIPVARAMVPEIQTVLYLSFKNANVTFRDDIHYMASSIYDFLMYDAALPTMNEMLGAGRKRVHRRPPPAEDYGLPRVYFGQEGPSPIVSSQALSRRTAVRDRVHRAPLVPPPAMPPPVEEPPMEVVLIDMSDAVSVPPPVPMPMPVPVVVNEDPPLDLEPEMMVRELKTMSNKDLLVKDTLKKIMKVQYDDLIDSC